MFSAMLPSQGPGPRLRWIGLSEPRRYRPVGPVLHRPCGPKRRGRVRGRDAMRRGLGRVLSRRSDVRLLPQDCLVPGGSCSPPVTAEKALWVFGDHLSERIKIHTGLLMRECRILPLCQRREPEGRGTSARGATCVTSDMGSRFLVRGSELRTLIMSRVSRPSRPSRLMRDTEERRPSSVGKWGSRGGIIGGC